MGMTAKEHFEWYVERAEQYFKMGNAVQGITSFLADMAKHEGTKNRIDPMLGFIGLMDAQQRGVEAARRWVEGFPSP